MDNRNIKVDEVFDVYTKPSKIMPKPRIASIQGRGDDEDIASPTSNLSTSVLMSSHKHKGGTNATRQSYVIPARRRPEDTPTSGFQRSSFHAIKNVIPEKVIPRFRTPCVQEGRLGPKDSEFGSDSADNNAIKQA
jgi:hypothetical protein